MPLYLESEISFCFSHCMAVSNSNKMDYPDPDWTLLQADLPIDQVDWDLVKTYLFDRFSTPPTTYLARQGQTIIEDVHSTRICEHIMHLRPCPSFFDASYQCQGLHPEFLLQGNDVIWTPRTWSCRAFQRRIDLATPDHCHVSGCQQLHRPAGHTPNSWHSEVGPFALTEPIGSPFTVDNPMSAANYHSTSSTTRTLSIAWSTKATCHIHPSSNTHGRRMSSHHSLTSMTALPKCSLLQPTTMTKTVSNSVEHYTDNAARHHADLDLNQLNRQTPIPPLRLNSCRPRAKSSQRRTQFLLALGKELLLDLDNPRDPPAKASLHPTRHEQPIQLRSDLLCQDPLHQGHNPTPHLAPTPWFHHHLLTPSSGLKSPKILGQLLIPTDCNSHLPISGLPLHPTGSPDQRPFHSPELLHPANSKSVLQRFLHIPHWR